MGGETKQIGQYTCFKATAMKPVDELDWTNMRRRNQDEEEKKEAKEDSTSVASADEDPMNDWIVSYEMEVVNSDKAVSKATLFRRYPLVAVSYSFQSYINEYLAGGLAQIDRFILNIDSDQTKKVVERVKETILYRGLIENYHFFFK